MFYLSGSHTLNAPREQVWPLIFDPIGLLGLIPGCKEIIQTAPGEYRGRVCVGMAAIRGTYESIVRILEEVPPDYCILDGELSGPTGLIQGKVRFTLIDCGVSSMIRYEAKGIITGALAAINKRIIEGTAQSLIKIGLARLNKQIKNQALHAEK